MAATEVDKRLPIGYHLHARAQNGEPASHQVYNNVHEIVKAETDSNIYNSLRTPAKLTTYRHSILKKAWLSISKNRA